MQTNLVISRLKNFLYSDWCTEMRVITLIQLIPAHFRRVRTGQILKSKDKKQKMSYVKLLVRNINWFVFETIE